MSNIRKQLETFFTEAIKEAFPSLEESLVEITPATQEKFGHYQCNSAMKLAKVLQRKPREVAQEILAHLSSKAIEKTEVAGPGFINIFLKKELLEDQITSLLQNPHLGIARPSSPQKIVIDFSSPNTAKEMHVGHLRSTIIGDSLANLFEFLGHNVLRLNHIGDWGTSFGMLIAHMRETHTDILEGKLSTDLSHLVSWYKESKKRFDEDPLFKKRAQEEVVALQSGDPASRKAWQIICEISQKAYKEVYNLLAIRLTDRGESFYNPMLADIVALLEEKKLAVDSDGATCVFVEGFQNREGDPLPLIIKKSDGGYNYATTDLAAIAHRVKTEKADRIIYVTDAGQQTHFQMIFETAKKAALLDPQKTRTDHVPFGLVLGKDGKKFRTRSGETERLIDLLHNAIHHAQLLLDERPSDLSPEEKRQLASRLGISAVKYADLSCNRISDYLFSYDRMLKFEGNTAVFLLYSYVRVAGIKRKVGKDIEPLIRDNTITLSHPSEVSLALQIAQFEETLEAMTEELLPNKLCDYLYHLAERFNAFFRDCRVEGAAEETSRLLLCEATARVIKQGLAILGISPVEKM